MPYTNRAVINNPDFIASFRLAIQTNDQAAIEDHLKPITHEIRHIVSTFFDRNHLYTDDIVQEVLLKILKKINDDKYDATRSSFSSWVYIITRSECRDMHIKLERRNKRLESLPPDEELVDPMDALVDRGTPDPSKEISGHETAAIVDDAVEEMRQQFPEAFLSWEMTTVERRDSNEVAAALGLLPGTVRSRRLSFEKHLQDHLVKKGIDVPAGPKRRRAAKLQEKTDENPECTISPGDSGGWSANDPILSNKLLVYRPEGFREQHFVNDLGGSHEGRLFVQEICTGNRITYTVKHVNSTLTGEENLDNIKERIVEKIPKLSPRQQQWLADGISPEALKIIEGLDPRVAEIVRSWQRGHAIGAA